MKTMWRQRKNLIDIVTSEPHDEIIFLMIFAQRNDSFLWAHISRNYFTSMFHIRFWTIHWINNSFWVQESRINYSQVAINEQVEYISTLGYRQQAATNVILLLCYVPISVKLYRDVFTSGRQSFFSINSYVLILFRSVTQGGASALHVLQFGATNGLYSSVSLLAIFS